MAAFIKPWRLKFTLNKVQTRLTRKKFEIGRSLGRRGRPDWPHLFLFSSCHSSMSWKFNVLITYAFETPSLPPSRWCEATVPELPGEGMAWSSKVKCKWEWFLNQHFFDEHCRNQGNFLVAGNSFNEENSAETPTLLSLCSMSVWSYPCLLVLHQETIPKPGIRLGSQLQAKCSLLEPLSRW